MNPTYINPRDEYFYQKGKKETYLKIAKTLLNDGMPIEEVCKITHITPDQLI